tara:strand:+ start:260 stop:1336 length:1077 start_codon:yes stop_codon:yes gene_type:complete
MKRNLKKSVFYVLSILLSVIGMSALIEIFLRVFLIPDIGIQASKYNEKIGLIHAEPNSNFIRVNVRYEKIKRRANSLGFYDKNIIKDKPKNIFRIGFFGDSYTESIQVPLEKTFFRIIEDSLKDENIETMAFGTSGHGTYHAYLKHKYFSSVLDIDKVVYVFGWNDIYDQYYPTKRSNQLPYPKLHKGEIVSDESYLNRYLKNENGSIIKKFFKNSFLYKNSVFLQTLNKRLYFLRKYGINTTSNKNYTNHHQSILKKDIDNAKRLFENVILNWKDECIISGKEFSIMYIPDENEYSAEQLNRFSMKPYLKKFCDNQNIDFIDPSIFFLKEEKQIYDDHFSELGHILFAKAFINDLRN